MSGNYLKKKTYYTVKYGKKNNCFFFTPSIVLTNNKQSSWISETRYITIGFLKYFYQVGITKINKKIDYSVNQHLIESIGFILSKHNYYISNPNELQTYLEKNKNIILLLRNCNPNNLYLQISFLNIIRFQSFIRKRKNEKKKHLS